VYIIYPTKFATQTSFAPQMMPVISEAILFASLTRPCVTFAKKILIT